MRAPFVILALVATPFITEVSAAQGNSAAGKAHKKDECSMPGRRKGHEMPFWIAKHLDKDCAAPAPTPDPVPTPPPQPPGTGTSVTGTVYLDLDYSTMPNPGEPRFAGWTVQLLSNGVVVQSTITDANGVYIFLDLPAGSYLVCGPATAGYVSWPGPSQSSACPNGTMGYPMSASTTLMNVAWVGLDFGYYKL